MATSAPLPSLVPPLPWLDPFLPPRLRGGARPGAPDARSAQDVRRARVVVVEALLSTATLLGVAVALVAGGYPFLLVGQALAAAGTTLAALAVVRRGGSSDVAAALIAAALVATPLFQSAGDTGMLDPAVMLVMVAPLAAAVASGLRLALATLAVALAGACVLTLLHLRGHTFPMLTDTQATVGWALVVLSSGSVLSLLAGVLYVRHSEAALTVVAAEAARLRDSLDASEARYRSLVERVPVGIYRSAPDGTLLLANPALAAFLGVARAEEALGLDVGVFYADPAQRAELREAVLRHGAVHNFEVDFLLPDGRERIVSLDAYVVRDADGALLYFEGTLVDVTEAHAARLALERSEARFRALVQRSSDVTLVVGARGRVAYASPAIEALLGVAPGDITGTDAWDWIHPDDVDEVRQVLATVVRMPGAVRSGEVRLRRADGEIVYADGIGASLFDDPAVGGFVVNLRDATERRRAQAVLVRAKQHAEEVAHLKSAFLANMSHEIRTPLTSILGYADVLADEVSDPEHREFVDLIARGGRRLMETLNSVLDLARFEAGRGDLALTPQPVAEAVDEAVRLLQPEARRRGVTLASAVEAPEALAALDDAAFARVLHNLAGNALKFTPEGGHVSVRVSGTAEHVTVEVRDTGIGIAPEFLPRLFSEFEQASSGVGRTHEGAGLGLAIAQQLVERMGGTIAVESTLDVGTAFTVTLPRADAAAPTPDTRPLALVVDDNEQARIVTSRVLEGRFRTVRAASGEEALALAAAETPDLAVLDIHLGAGADGTEVMRRLRQMPGLATLPVVAVTAFGLTGDRARYLAMGFDEYVPKPFTRDALLAAVAEACDRTAERSAA